MFTKINISVIAFVFLLNININGLGYSPEYSSNPFSFSIPEKVYNDQFFVFDLNGDGLIDYTFRSETKLYAYNHNGTKLWDIQVKNPGGNRGTKHGAADVDGDGHVEIVALDSNDQILIYRGSNGFLERTIPLTNLGSEQKAGHIVIVNLRGAGDHDAIVQTVDTMPEGSGIEYYINRTLIALNLENGQELWRVEQDNKVNKPNTGDIYEGYWGQTHGALICADVDLDGMDEVVGGNMIDHDSTEIGLGYDRAWIGYTTAQIDHLDAVSVGDFRPDLPGLEWIVTEEDHVGKTNSWHTTFLRYDTSSSNNHILWRVETDLFEDSQDREPQNIAPGNFDSDMLNCEVWVRSRMGNATMSQHPWLFDSSGVQFADYTTDDVLPPGFNSHPDSNKKGLEMIWTIDWSGEPKEYIAAKARHVDGNIGVFDAVTGEAVWCTPNDFNSVNAYLIYVADVAGDSREEVVICDSTNGSHYIKVFWNNQSDPDQLKPDKWEDPLYSRLKQNWNYYSPGSYTYFNYPIVSNVVSTNIDTNSATITWKTDVNSDSQVEYGLTASYGSITQRDLTLRTTHSIQLTGLTQNTEYHYQVRSVNAYNKLGVSKDYTFTVHATEPPIINDMTIQESNQLTLTWTVPAGATGYNVYRGTDAYFTPDITGGSNRIASNINDENTDLPGIQWTDPSNGVGDWQTNHFYVVTFVRAPTTESDPSNRVGEFDYQLMTTSTTDFNDIALPLNPFGTSLSSVSQLMSLIPMCNSIAVWNAENQGYIQYVPEIPYPDKLFDVSITFPYFVNITQDTTFTLVGEVVDPTFNLITTPTTDWNKIMLPLSKTNIIKASDLLNDISISSCNSVASWNASVQGYDQQYDPAIPASDFNVSVGYPYSVNVTSNVTWPEGGSPKRTSGETGVITRSERSQVPHVVWGSINVDGDTLLEKSLQFNAFIKDRPEEKLSHNSPGCKLKNGYWIVQCGNFPSPWKAEEVLRVEFKNEDGHYIGVIEVILSYEPVDEAEEIIKIKTSEPLPTTYGLSQNFPNPFNSETKIKFQLPEPAKTSIRIYNMLGQEISTLMDKKEKAGFYEIVWNGKDNEENPVSSGIYLLYMKTEKYFQSRKILFIQ